MSEPNITSTIVHHVRVHPFKVALVDNILLSWKKKMATSNLQLFPHPSSYSCSIEGIHI